MVLPRVLIETRENCNDKVAGSHEEGAGDEDGLPAGLIDPYDGRNGREEHHNAYHTGGEKRDGVACQAEVPEDERCVVENGVDTGPLLEEHGQRPNGNTVE